MPTKEDIKKWLKEKNLKREQFAEMLFVSLQTVKTWLSKNGRIPEAKLVYIKKLMEDSERNSSLLLSLPDLDERGRMFVYLTEKGQKEVYSEAARLNMDPSTYCTLAVEWCCDQPDIGERLRARLEAERKNENIITGDKIPGIQRVQKLPRVAENAEGYSEDS